MDITVVKRLHEDRVLDMMEALEEKGLQGSDDYKLLEGELERRANQREQSKKESEARKLQNLKDRIAAKWSGRFSDFEKWDAWARSLYKVDDNYTVTSLAVNWKEEKQWECGSEYEAVEKIEQLVTYKEYDRERGSGSYAEDLEKLYNTIEEGKDGNNDPHSTSDDKGPKDI